MTISYSATKSGVNKLRLYLALAGVLVLVSGYMVKAAAEPVKSRHPLGNLSTLEGWSGLENAPGAGPDGGDAARLTTNGKVEFRYPEEKAGDWYGWPVLTLDVKLPEDMESAELTFSLISAEGAEGAGFLREVSVPVAGNQWQTLYLSVDDFRVNEEVAPRYVRKNKGLRIQVQGEEAQALLANVRLQRGRAVGLMVPKKSKPGDQGGMGCVDMGLCHRQTLSSPGG